MITMRGGEEEHDPGDRRQGEAEAGEPGARLRPAFRGRR